MTGSIVDESQSADVQIVMSIFVAGLTASPPRPKAPPAGPPAPKALPPGPPAPKALPPGPPAPKALPPGPPAPKALPPGPPAPKAPHGNSLNSTKLHHVYEIIDTKTGAQYKTGISGQKLNANGTSPRANRQVNQLNKNSPGRYQARVVAEGLPNRRAALAIEQHLVNGQQNTAGGVGPGQALPKPNAKYGPLAR